MREVAYKVRIEMQDWFSDEGTVVFELENGKIYGEGLLTLDFIEFLEVDECLYVLIYNREIYESEKIYELFGVLQISKEEFEIPGESYYHTDYGTMIIEISEKLSKKSMKEFQKKLNDTMEGSVFMEPE